MYKVLIGLSKWFGSKPLPLTSYYKMSKISYIIQRYADAIKIIAAVWIKNNNFDAHEKAN